MNVKRPKIIHNVYLIHKYVYRSGGKNPNYLFMNSMNLMIKFIVIFFSYIKFMNIMDYECKVQSCKYIFIMFLFKFIIMNIKNVEI